MRPDGLFNPKNAIESSGGFKEGLVLIDSACYKVHQPRSGDDGEARNTYLALAWQCTRLDEDREPLEDPEGNPITEEIVFSAGGKSLQHAHPGCSDAFESDDIEDAGVEINAEGATIFIVNNQWHPDKKSALINLQDSLMAKGVSAQQVDRCWAPDYVGAIVHLSNKPSGQTFDRFNSKTGKMEPQTFSYKVVTNIIRGFGQGKDVAVKKDKKTTKATTTSTTASSATSQANGKVTDPAEAEANLKPILDLISEEQTGQSMTKKSLAATVNKMLGERKVPPPLVMPIMNMVRDDKWLTENGARFTFTFNPANNQVTFS